MTRWSAMEIVDTRRLQPVDQMNALARALLAPLALPLSAAYGALVGLWWRLPRPAFDPGKPVISVGSVLVGGSGKTPLCIYLAGALAGRGRRVCVISRGYMRRGKRSPLVVSDGKGPLVSVEEAGDEPFLMASRLAGVSVVVGKNRARAASEALARLGPDIFILDDGFQCRGLVKTLEIVCLDREALRSRERFLPWGRLRQSPGRISAGDLVVVVEDGRALPGEPKAASLGATAVFRASRERPVFLSREGVPVPVEDLRRSPVLVLSGIGRPAGFEAACVAAGLAVPVAYRTDDHHWYGRRDVRRIAKLMLRHRCGSIVTTEKDLVRLPAGVLKGAVALRADLCLEDAGGFLEAVERSVERR